jgi:hypothetical protein
MNFNERAIPIIRRIWRLHYRHLGSAIWRGALVLVMAGSAGCGLLEGLGPSNEDTMATAVALTVTAQAVPSATTLPGSPTPEPTLIPTQQAVLTATSTLEPTLAVVASLTPVPYPPPVFPTIYPTVTSGSCCTLKVWNRNSRITYWIGTQLPLGGNYISPGYYVTFPVARNKWIRIFWCRRVDYNRWTDESMDDFYHHYGNDLRFYCRHEDVQMDLPLDKSIKELIIQ